VASSAEYALAVDAGRTFMDDTERRQHAWNYALHAEGTRVVFERRANSLRYRTHLRDFLGIAVPICVAYLLGSEVFEPLKPFRHLGVGVLGVAALLQALMVAWSLIAHWDEELAYDIRAARESYLLKEAWKKLGHGNTSNLAIEYDLISHQQSIADSHDVEKNITETEKQLGMRAGLIEFQRACVCGVLPTNPRRPWLLIRKPCAVCGGN
jgi:mobilome CxxCx(11)CxxC protein